MKKNILNRNDIIIGLLIFIFSILVCFPIINYQIVGDVTAYAESASNLYHHKFYGYETPEGIKYETDVPPLFPLASGITFAFVNNPAFAVKITSIIFFALTAALIYFFSRKIKSHFLITLILLSRI